MLRAKLLPSTSSDSHTQAPGGNSSSVAAVAASVQSESFGDPRIDVTSSALLVELTLALLQWASMIR